MFENLILALIFITFLYFIYYTKKSKNIPPGPWGYPLFGNITIMRKPRVHEVLTKLGEKYGNVFSISLGPKLIVVLNNYEAMKEALVKQGDSFTARPPAYLFECYQDNGGIVFSSGKVWRDQRRFALHTLRDFGFGRSSLEDRIMVEVQNIIDVIASHNGKPFQFGHLLDKASCNVICSLVFDKRFDYNDKQLDDMLELMNILFDNFYLMNPLNFFPLLRFVSQSFKDLKRSIDGTREYMNKIIDEHLATYQQDSPRDFIDAYITQMKEEEAKDINDTTYKRDNLVKSIENFFNAGTETTSTTIIWGIMYMMHYPHIQKKIQAELQGVIGNSLASLSDRNNLPYTEAATLEIQRLATLVPLSVFHMAENDTILYNYFIPKGTIIIPNIYAAHLDPKYWPNPTEFKPERYLDNQGKVIRNMESLVPFSLGKRACLGDSLAKNELFLFFANFLQRFTFSVPNGESPPDMDNYIEGITLRPEPFNLCAQLR